MQLEELNKQLQNSVSKSRIDGECVVVVVNSSRTQTQFGTDSVYESAPEQISGGEVKEKFDVFCRASKTHR